MVEPILRQDLETLRLEIGLEIGQVRNHGNQFVEKFLVPRLGSLRSLQHEQTQPPHLCEVPGICEVVKTICDVLQKLLSQFRKELSKCKLRTAFKQFLIE